MGLGFGKPNCRPLDFSRVLWDISIMENNNTPSVPNSPAELFAMQAANVAPTECPDSEAFAELLAETVLPGFEPSPYQTVRGIVMLLERLEHFHFDTLQESDEMDPWQREIWERDYKRISTALEQLRLVYPD